MAVSGCGVDDRGIEDLQEAPITTTTTVGQATPAAPGTDGDNGGAEVEVEADPSTTVVTTTVPRQGDPVVVAYDPTHDALLSFDTCPVLLEAIKQQAVPFVGAYGIEASGFATLLPQMEVAAIDDLAEATLDSVGSPTSADTTRSDAGGTRFSTTNVQEVGVDEPDLVKTDGERILTVADGVLHYIEVQSPAVPVVISSFDIREWDGLDLSGHQMFMSGDTVILLAHDWGTWPDAATAVVSQLDISDPSDISITSTITVEGSIAAARLIGDRLTVVVHSDPLYRIPFVSPYDMDPEDTWEQSAEAAVVANRQAVMETDAEEWFPTYTVTGPEGVSDRGLLVDCRNFHVPSAFSGTGTITVLQADIGEPLAVNETDVSGIMSGAGPVYASNENLYVTTEQWIHVARPSGRSEDEHEEWLARQVEALRTRIHRFDISGDDGPDYTASGSVPGRLLSQFSMSEHDGYLRVASTTVPNWLAGGRWADTDSRVDVLEVDGNRLRTVGSVGGLGKGEDIFAVRFMGEVGYVVTFRQTDPLYTIDLSEPTAPSVEGELKILGYSAYLHPIGDGLLLGVGQDADERGVILGTQLSVFDVSDLSDPVRLHQYTLPEYSGSEAEYDHHAFLYWPPTGTAVMPVTVWDKWGSTFAAVFGIDPSANGGIAERGRIEHRGPGSYQAPRSPAIRRSLVIGDVLYTVSAAGVKASDIASTETLSWMAFPHPPQIVVFLPESYGWANRWTRAAEMAAEEHGYELVSVVAYDQFEQLDQVESLVEDAEYDPPAAYVWWPVDTAGYRVEPVLLQATGVPVFGTSWHAAPPPGTEDYMVAFIGADPEADGAAVGELMLSARDYLSNQGVALHGNDGTAVIIDVGYWGHAERVASMERTLDAGGVEVLDSVVIDRSDVTLYRVVENMVTTNDGIDILYLPAVTVLDVGEAWWALDENGYTIGEDILLVGGSCHQARPTIEDSDVYGVLLRSPFVDGKTTIDTVIDYLSSGSELPKMVHPPTATIRSPAYTPGENEFNTISVGGYTAKEACSS